MSIAKKQSITMLMIMLFLSLLTSIEGSNDSETYNKEEIVHISHTNPRAINLVDDVLILSTSNNETLMTKFTSGGRILYENSRTNISYVKDEDAQLISRKRHVLVGKANIFLYKYYLGYHSENINGTPDKEDLISFKDRFTDLSSVELSNKVFKKKSYLGLKNGYSFIGTISKNNETQKGYIGSIFYVNDSNIYKGDEFDSSGDQLSCFESKENEVYCVHISEDTSYISKISLRKYEFKCYYIGISDPLGYNELTHYESYNTTVCDFISSKKEQMIKMIHSNFTYLKAISIDEYTMGLIYQSPKYKLLPCSVEDGQYLYYIQSNIFNTSKVSAYRFEYLYDKCIYNANTGYDNPTLAAISKNRVIVVCQTIEKNLHFMVITNNQKDILHFNLNSPEFEYQSSPSFVYFGQSIAVVYSKKENDVDKTALRILDYPDCNDFSIQVPIYTIANISLPIFLSNSYFGTKNVSQLFITNITLSSTHVNPELLQILEQKTQYIAAANIKFSKDEIFSIIPPNKTGNFSFSYYSYASDDIDGDIAGKECRVTVSVPKCYDGCYSCWSQSNSTYHNCLLKCVKGYYIDSKLNTKPEANYDGTYGPIFDCLQCAKGCTECDIGQNSSSTNCIPKQCNNSQGYYYVENDEANCLNENEIEIYAKKIDESYYLTTENGYTFWKKIICHENCLNCSRKGDDTNNNCDSCKEDYHFFFNETIPGSCYIGKEEEGFYVDAQDNKYHPCKNGCRKCDNSATCNKCYNSSYLFLGECKEKCPEYLAYDEDEWECVNCKSRYGFEKYNYQQKCYDYIISSYHVYNYTYNLVTRCDSDERCFECLTEGSNQCTKCYDDKYKEHFIDTSKNYFDCYTYDECKEKGGIPQDSEGIINTCSCSLNTPLLCRNCKMENKYRDISGNSCISSKPSTAFVDNENYNSLVSCQDSKHSVRNCYECDNQTTCNRCISRYTFIDGIKKYCQPIFTMQNSSVPDPNDDTNYISCKNVIDQCRTCLNITYCLTCSKDYGVLYTHEKCINNKNQEYYENETDHLYYPCNYSMTGCQYCSDFDTCLKCENGYEMLFDTNECKKETEIEDDYYKNKTDDLYHPCSEIPGCQRCTDEGKKCTSCQERFAMRPESNVCEDIEKLESNIFYYENQTDTYKFCNEDINNCEKCFYDSEKQILKCILCDSSFTLVNKNYSYCFKESDYNNTKEYFTNDTGAHYYSCDYGVEHCSQCSGEKVCTLCEKNFAFLNNQNDKCFNESYYINNKTFFSNNTGIYSCRYGVDNCRRCNSGDDCISCRRNYTIVDNDHQKCYLKTNYENNTLYFTNDTGRHFYSCHYGVDNCEECNGENICSLCSSDYTIVNDNNTKCYPKKDYQNNSEYYTSDNGKHYYSCNYGVQNCSQCNAEKVCTLCSTGFTLVNDVVDTCYPKKDYENCSDYFTKDEGIHYYLCSYGVKYCHKCQASDLCTECSSQYAIVNNVTNFCYNKSNYENDKFYTIDEGKNYYSCDKGVYGCSRCSAENYCKECNSELILVDDVFDTCYPEEEFNESSFYYPNDDRKHYYSCSHTVQNCEQCTSERVCTKCSNNYTLINNIVDKCEKKSKYVSNSAYFTNDTGVHYYSCDKEISNCAQCSSQDVCTRCNDEFTIFNDDSSQCYEKKLFTNNTSYYTNDDGTHFYSCNYKDTKCEQCNSEKECTKCSDEFIFVNEQKDKCYQKSDYEKNPKYYTTDNGTHYYSCNKGVTNCEKCESEKVCTLCSNKYTLINDIVNTCYRREDYEDNSEYYPTENGTHYYSCNKSVVNCEQCSAENVCTRCSSDFTLIDNDFMNCHNKTEFKNNLHYFTNESEYHYYQCKYGVNECDECTSEKQCIKCNPSYIIVNDVTNICNEKSNYINNTLYFPNDSGTNYYSCNKGVKNCERCESGKKCTKCENGFTIVNNDYENCKDKNKYENDLSFFKNNTGDNYYSCYYGVKNCFQCNSENECIRCLNSFTIVNDDSSKCYSKSDYEKNLLYYTKDNGTHYYSCDKGVQNCEQCNAEKECILCSDSYALLNDEVDKCYSKSTFENSLDYYYKEDDQKHYYSCDYSIPNCQTCNGEKKCTQCENGFTIVDDNSEKCYDIKDVNNTSYFTRDKGKHYYSCKYGVKNCDQCQAEYICLKCQNNFILVDEIENTCYNKTDYENNDKYFADETKTHYYSCLKYNSIDNCERCLNISTCKYCKNSFTFINQNKNECKKIEELGNYYYPDPNDDSNYLQCSEMDSKCQTCLSLNQCLSCIGGYGLYIDSKTCVDTTKNEYYHNNTVGLFYPCNYKKNYCNQCSDADHCQKCDNGYGLLQDGNKCVKESEIGNEYYYNSTDETYYNCSNNLIGCKQCSKDGQKCTLCEEDTYIREPETSQCIDKELVESEEYYLDKNDGYYKFCYEKISECNKCYINDETNEVKCKECNSLFTLVNKNSSYCFKKSNYINKKEYFTNDTGIHYYLCDYGVKDCNLCDSENICTKCKTNFSLLNLDADTCYDQNNFKDNKEYFTNDTGKHYYSCKYGVANCSLCDSEGVCRKCFNTHTIVDNKYGSCKPKSDYETNGEYYTPDNGTIYYPCYKGVKNCRKCSSEKICTQCSSDYALVNGDVSTCYIKKYYAYNTSFYTPDKGINYYSCQNKLANCQKCDIESEYGFCLACSNDFTIVDYNGDICKLKSDYQNNPKYYTDDDGKHYQICNYTVSYCIECSAKRVCTKCDNEHSLLNDIEYNCFVTELFTSNGNKQKYFTNETGHYYTCNIGVDHCDTCNSSTECTSCKKNFALVNNNSHICYPKEDYINNKSYYTINNGKNYQSCKYLVANCDQCEINSGCTKCVNGFSLVNDNKKQCYNSSLYENNKYYTKDNGINYYSCSKGVENCEQCESEKVCTSCNTNYVLIDNDSEHCYSENIYKNDDQYFKDGEHYYSCLLNNKIQNCKRCNDRNTCKVCNAQYYFLNDDTSECILKNDSYAIDPNNETRMIKCTDAMIFCETCSSATKCLTCLGDYYSINFICTLNCEVIILQLQKVDTGDSTQVDLYVFVRCPLSNGEMNITVNLSKIIENDEGGKRRLEETTEQISFTATSINNANSIQELTNPEFNKKLSSMKYKSLAIVSASSKNQNISMPEDPDYLNTSKVEALIKEGKIPNYKKTQENPNFKTSSYKVKKTTQGCNFNLKLNKKISSSNNVFDLKLKDSTNEGNSVTAKCNSEKEKDEIRCSVNKNVDGKFMIKNSLAYDSDSLITLDSETDLDISCQINSNVPTTPKVDNPSSDNSDSHAALIVILSIVGVMIIGGIIILIICLKNHPKPSIPTAIPTDTCTPQQIPDSCKSPQVIDTKFNLYSIPTEQVIKV